MKDFFWSIFEKSGNIDAFMAYKEYMDFNNAKSNTGFDSAVEKGK